jgi:hypothetical protein
LPYGVKVQIDLQSDIYPPITCKVCSIEYAEPESAFIGVETSPDTYNEFREFLCKPYLFPMSSMTEEQRVEAFTLLNNCDYYTIDNTIKWLDNHPIKFFDWCDKNHFDYRGLIPMGLAIDATDKNIY